MSRKLAMLAAVASLTCMLNAQRLPHTVIPEHYRLTFTPHFDNDTFSGDETIAVRILQPGSTITLNAAHIEFQQVTVNAGGSTQDGTVATNAPEETATFTFAKPLSAGPAQLHIRYTGRLSRDMRGLYLSTENGRKYAITQFEATDARRAYPCFDEPAYKATFEITAIVPKGDKAFSNSRVESDTPGPGPQEHTVKFATTPKLSTYVTALAVGDFQCLDGSADGIPIRFCGTPERYQMGKFALDAAQYVMHFYNQYFSIKYPYGKLDFIAVADFSAGAMENPGCIIGREELMLGDPQTSTPQHLKRIAQDAVAHEMAHQWFGDLVTLQWWNDSWLNEGFATWMAFKPIEQWKPEWHMDQDRVSSYTKAMSSDSLPAAHPVSVKVESPGQIESIFDFLTYEKAGAVLEMVEGYVGHELFRQGVNAYLEKHQYGNATAEDFWNTIAEVTHKPVDRIMASFVVQPGVPLLTFRESCQHGSTTLKVTQERYFADRKLFNAGSPELWTIPVCVKSGIESCQLLSTRQATWTVTGCEPAYGNAGARGYYRTAYDATAFRQLASTAESARFPLERIMLASDLWAATRIDLQRIDSYLAFAHEVRNDGSGALAKSVQTSLRYLGDYVVTAADRPRYRAWLRQEFEPVMKHIGWAAGPNDAQDLREIRGQLLETLGVQAEDPHAISEARALVERDLEKQAVDPTLIGPALSIAARHGDALLFDAYLARVRSPQNPEDYLRHLFALCDFRQPALLQRALEFGLSPEFRSQDSIYLFGAMLQTPTARPLAWDFIRQHWAAVEAKVTPFMAGFLVRSTGTFCDPAARDQVKAFFTEHKLPTATPRRLDESLEHINACIDFKAQQSATLAAWLNKVERKARHGE
jgi:aminopeptidase N